MKNFITILLLLTATAAYSQTVMKIHKSDSTSTQFPLTGIDSIFFSTAGTPVMHIHQSNGTANSIFLSGIDSVTHPTIPPLEIADNVVLIDSLGLVLDSVASDFDNGIYVFNNYNPTIGEVVSGDIIIGTEGEGYLRKVTSREVNGSIIRLTTTQGALTDVFKAGGFRFEMDMDDMISTRSEGLDFTLNSRTLFELGPLKIELLDGGFTLNPNWVFEMEFDELGVERMECSTSGSSYTAYANVKATATASSTLFNKTDTLGEWRRSRIFMVGWVPVVVVMELQWLATYSATLSGAVSSTANLNVGSPLELGVLYEDEQWHDIYNVSSTSIWDYTQPGESISLALKYAWRPKLSFKLYGVAGPYSDILAPTAQVTGTVGIPSLDWDVKADAWLRTALGAEVTVLGRNLVDFGPKVYETPKLSYRMPYKIVKVSGDNQQGPGDQPLGEPVKVQVLNNQDGPVGGVKVYFTVHEMDGTVADSVVVTDSLGFAETVWTLGEAQNTTQNLQASARFGTMDHLSGSPVDFTAEVDTTGGCEGISSVMDIDGNTYPAVQIGNQCWTKENLRTTKYADGSVIPNITEPTVWSTLTTGAWSNYNNDAANEILYGKLYNWYTVADPRNVCPDGWHVPSDAEWTVLTDFLGGSSVAGGKMKSVSGWNPPNTGATNSSGFSGLPGGTRWANDGTFLNLGDDGYWWSATANDGGTAWRRGLGHNDGGVDRNGNVKRHGFSVRCVRD